MKHFIVAAGLYTLCSAQGSASPSGYVYGAYVNESNDVHDLAIQLLDTCPALDLPGTNERCRNAPAKIASTIGPSQSREFADAVDLINMSTDYGIEGDCVDELKDFSRFVNQAVDDASVLRRLACEPTKLNGEEQSFVNALSRRDKAVQRFVDAYKTRVADLPSTSECVGQTTMFDALVERLVASDEETQNYFGLEALLYCTGLNDLL